MYTNGTWTNTLTEKAPSSIRKSTSVKNHRGFIYLLLIPTLLNYPASAANTKREKAAARPRVTSRTARKNNTQLVEVLAKRERALIRDGHKQLIVKEDVL